MINNCNNWFYLCLALLGVILAMLAMFFGYSLKLDQRTVKLEKKNGKELREIAELRKEIQGIRSSLPKEQEVADMKMRQEKADQKHDHDQ